VDLEQKSPSQEDRWYLQQRGELPDDWEPLTVEEISELRSEDEPLGVVRHTDDIPMEQIPNTGVVGNQPDAGPEKSALETPAGRLGATYESEQQKALRKLRAEQLGEDASGGSTAPIFGAEVQDLDTDDESEGAKQANERIRKRRASRAGTSVHEQPQEAALRDPEHPVNVAEREAQDAEAEAAQAAKARREAEAARRESAARKR
jgi:hypothetical protein